MPEALGKYPVISVIGSGASGTVYLAADPGLDRKVAIKRLAPSLATEPGFMEGFREEAAIMARLDHPNCVHVYDYFEDQTGAYLVSEYVAGASLRRLLDQHGRLGPEQALGVTRGALTGLAYAHELSLVHRDVKPDNLLADVEGVSKLADFGQAFFTAEVKGGARQSTGSPAYMSPEQVRGDQGDVRSDVYAAGVVLYEFLAGRPPFIALSRLAVMKMHLDRDPPELNRVNPRVPLRISKVVGTALAKPPAERYSSAGEFLAVLEEAARDAYGAGWLEAASIAAMVSAVAAAGEQASASAVTETGATEVGRVAIGPETVAERAPAPAPEPEPEPATGPDPTPSPEVAVAAAAADSDAAEESPSPGHRPAWLGAGIAAAVAGLVLGAALGVVKPLTGRSAAPGSVLSPSPSTAGPSVGGIDAHFDPATSTTYYQVRGTPQGAGLTWGWLRRPPCGALQADPGGQAAAYAHNGCDPVAEAQGLVGVCVSTSGGSSLFQRNARFGDGALALSDATAAGVSSDQFRRAPAASASASPGVPLDCQTAFGANAAATVTPFIVPGATPAPSGIATESPSATATATPALGSPPGASDPVPATAALVGGLLLAVAGLLMLRRPAESP